jgi:hypothetical protein
MGDNDWYAPAFLAVFLTLGVTLLMGHSLGYDTGLRVGKNETVTLCVEKPKECKVIYDYLKLQKAQ